MTVAGRLLIIFTLMPQPAPYDFVFDYLPSRTVVKSRFGMHYVYLDKKIVLMLRKTGKGDGLNGIFVATVKAHHLTLINDVPALTGFTLDTGERYESHWKFLSEEDDAFERSAIKICELISHGDKRIGKATKGAAAL